MTTKPKYRVEMHQGKYVAWCGEMVIQAVGGRRLVLVKAERIGDFGTVWPDLHQAEDFCREHSREQLPDGTIVWSLEDE